MSSARPLPDISHWTLQQRAHFSDKMSDTWFCASSTGLIDRDGRAFLAYGRRFGPLHLTFVGMNGAERRKAARACRKAVDRGRPFTRRELRRLEPECPPGVWF